MNAILERISQAGDIFVDFAWPMLIQSGVLILILLVVDLLLRKRVRAVFRYWIWMLVLVKLVLPTSLSSPLSLGNWFGDKLARMPITQTRAGSAVELPQATLSEALPNTNLTRTEAAPAVVQNPTITQVEQHETAVEPMRPVGPPVIIPVTLSWRAVLFLGWLAVVAAMGLLLMQRMIFVRGLIEQAGPADGSMKDVLDNCCRRVGVKRKIGIKLSNNATSPAVCGLYRPVILVPQNIAASLNQDQLQVVLLHELAHIKRGDLWVNFVQTILQIIYFYNPLLWLANAIIRRVREQAVDEMVLVAMGEQAGQYPQTLVSVAKLAFERPALSLRLIGVVESKSALTGRIKRILSRPIPKTAKLGIISLLVIVIAAAFLLPMAKEDAFGGWFGKEKLIKFSSDDKPTGTSKGSGDTTTYSKNYTVKFRKGEKLAIVAELYQVGKPMRSLGCKIFSGSEQPQELSIFLEKNHLNEEKTSVKHELRVTLGDQDFRLNDIFVDTLEIFSVTEWGFFNGPEIVAQKRKGEPYAEFENLLSIRVCPNGGRPRAPRIWMPTYNNVTWIDSDAYFIWVNMLPLSQLDNLRLTVPNFYEKLQLPDGTYLSPNASRDERTAVVDDYILNLKRALMREQMPLPELTAHKYYKVGEPIHISVDGGGAIGNLLWMRYIMVMISIRSFF